MKRILSMLAMFILLSVTGLIPAHAADVSWFIDCKEFVNDQHTIWLGYSANKDYPDANFAWIGNGPEVVSSDITKGVHHKVVRVIFPQVTDTVTLWIDPQHVEITVSKDTRASVCVSGTGRPDGGIATVTLDAAPGLYHWEKMDAYGHWGDTGAETWAQSEGDRSFVRLPLGPDNADTDPSHYRIFPVG